MGKARTTFVLGSDAATGLRAAMSYVGAAPELRTVVLAFNGVGTPVTPDSSPFISMSEPR